jgi:hypothetical protein
MRVWGAGIWFVLSSVLRAGTKILRLRGKVVSKDDINPESVWESNDCVIVSDAQKPCYLGLLYPCPAGQKTLTHVMLQEVSTN